MHVCLGHGIHGRRSVSEASELNPVIFRQEGFRNPEDLPVGGGTGGAHWWAMSGQRARGTNRDEVHLSQMETFANPSVSRAVSIGGRGGSDARVDPALLGNYIHAALASAAGGRRLTRADLSGFRERGQTAAEQGVALPALLDLYLSATWRLWADLENRVDATARPIVSAVAGALFRAADDAVAALAQGYDTAQRQAVRREESQRREFVDDLLAGTAQPELLEERAARFGFVLAATHIVTIARTHRPLVDAGPVQAKVEAHVLATFRGRDVVVATKEGALVCVLPATSSDPTADILAALNESGEAPWRIALGRPHAGPGGVVRSYHEAREALEVAERLELPDPIARFSELLPYRLLALDPTTAADTVETVLGPLRGARGCAEPLIETLEAFFSETGNISATARRLHLSPRAVTYRLERVEQLTRHSPVDPEGRFILELALRCRRLLDRGQAPAH